jgi:hypothetical protein
MKRNFIWMPHDCKEIAPQAYDAAHRRSIDRPAKGIPILTRFFKGCGCLPELTSLQPLELLNGAAIFREILRAAVDRGLQRLLRRLLGAMQNLPFS